jgi:hypothetical protein
MIKFNTNFKIKFPDRILAQDALLEAANKIFIPEMVANIHRRVAIDGTGLPVNDPQTIIAKGHDCPLIGKGRHLIKSFIANKMRAETVRITLSSNRKEIGTFLQKEGIKTKTGRKFYKFFGINDDLEAAAMMFLTKKAKETCDKFNGK